MSTRARYFVLAICTIALGLALRAGGGVFGASVRDMLGDALWAAMIVWWTGVGAPAARLTARSTTALAICFGVELSQLYHTPWLDALRSTAGGHLVLGSGFDPRDLVAYGVGVLAAVLLERTVARRAARTTTSGRGTPSLPR